MEEIISTMKPFFEDPGREFGIRELSRITGINHMTVRMRLRKMVSYGLLKTRKSGIYGSYVADFTKQYANLKLYYNLEKIRKSGMVEFIEKEFDYPVLVVFGSYSKSADSKGSDTDLCLISNAKRSVAKELLDDRFYTRRFGKVLGRSVSMHAFTKDEFSAVIQKDPGFANSVANGIVLSGELVIA